MSEIIQVGDVCYERGIGFQNAYRVYDTMSECQNDPLGYYNSAIPTCQQVVADRRVSCSPSEPPTPPTEPRIDDKKGIDPKLIIIAVIAFILLLKR